MQNEIPFDQRDFFQKPFSRTEITRLLDGRPAMEMFNPRSPAVKKLEREPELYSDAELIDLMAAEPRLIRRPVVRIGGKAYFGADAYALEKILGQPNPPEILNPN